jgi:ribosomal protein S18 acetylase RimI-like enzyme
MARARLKPAGLRIRAGRIRDLAALLAIEQAVFTVDHLSRRGFRAFLSSPRAVLLVAAGRAEVLGYALVLFRQASAVARLYSIGVARQAARRGIGIALLAAAERAARRRNRSLMRLEVQTGNARAIARYEKSGYRRIGRVPGYYNDGSDAYRYETPRAAPGARQPPRTAAGTTQETCE